MEKTIGAFEARRRFGQLIEEAFYRRDRFIIERSGRAMAVLVPIEDYRVWEKLAKERLFSQLEQIWQRTADVPVEELEADVEKAEAMLRREPVSEKGQ